MRWIGSASKQIVIIGTMSLVLGLPPTAVALPYLTKGNARHTLEKRFEYNEERYGTATYTLGNCYRVSATHVNCYAEAYASATSCEVELWRVWEAPLRRGHGWFGMRTQGQYWEECAEESA